MSKNSSGTGHAAARVDGAHRSRRALCGERRATESTKCEISNFPVGVGSLTLSLTLPESVPTRHIECLQVTPSSLE